MNRGLAHFSTLSIALTVVFFAALGLALLLRGGLLFSPGPVSAAARADQAFGEYTSHADFERQCARCHRPLRAAQADLCVECHLTVRAQLADQTGLHARLPNRSDCAACHPEHRGRDFDPVEAALVSFDHNILTTLPLEGRHANLECADCHTGGQYNQAEARCIACHAEPDIHAGLFGEDCAACHTAAGWQPAAWNGRPFDHAVGRFSLSRHASGYDGQPMPCSACHTGAGAEFLPGSCAGCHGQHDPAFMEAHTRQFGPDCLACHDGVDRMSNFDHARVFPLEGQHADLACQDCHAGASFASMGNRCADCHAEPDIHVGAFGFECQMCHTAQGWLPALLSSHSFPLDHGEEGEIACQTCHPAGYTAYTCTDCHEHTPAEVNDDHRDEGISLAELERCADCHPTGEE